MKFLYLLSLVIFCEGSSLPEPPKDVNLTEVTSYRMEQNKGFLVNWTEVEDEDDNDPILGYKVTVWEEELPYFFELKDDGTLVRKQGSQLPKVVAIDRKVNELVNLRPNGQFAVLEEDDIMYRMSSMRPKMVYKLDPEGQLVKLNLSDVPVLTLQHDSNTKVTVIDVSDISSKPAFYKTKRNCAYEVGVQSYTLTSMGPMSKIAKIFT